MKKIIIGIFLILISLLGLSNVNANGERKYESLPQITEGTFTNYAWGATMEVGIDTTHSQDGKNAFKLAKTSVSNSSNNGASIYYQSFGSKVKALGVSDYVGLKLTVYNEFVISGGLAFMFDGTEIYEVEAYAEENENLASRNLDYEGYRTYIVPFDDIEVENVNEFQINIWGTEAATIYVSQLEVVYTGEKVVEPERKYESLPEIVDGTFTNFAWGATMEVGIDTTHSQDGKNAFKLAKTSVSNSSNNGASIYYQSFGSKVKALGVSDYVGLKLTIYNESIISGGLAFMFDGTEIYEVEAYDEENEDLASRNLDYEGYRTYIIPFDELDIENVSEFQINIWGSEAATIYVSQLEVVYTGEKSVIDTPIEEELPPYSYLLNGFENNEDIEMFGINGSNNTEFNLSLNNNAEFIITGNGSANYKWEHQNDEFSYTEIYLNVGSYINGFIESDIQGISFDLINTNTQIVGDVGFWIKATEDDESEYEASYEQIIGGTGLASTTARKVYIPFSSFTKLQDYTIDENNQFDLSQLCIIKFGLWSNCSQDVLVDLYLDNFCLLANNEMNDDNISKPEPPKPNFEKAPPFSYSLSGFESIDLSNWGISGTSGTVYTINPTNNPLYVKQGSESLKYHWSNELYSFGYTEIYMNVSSYIDMFVDNDLKGISFWIYVESEQTVGEVGFWVKAAEADGSEYEAYYGLIEGGTALDSVGWKQVYVPFSSFTVEQVYATDENGVLDVEQLAYLKIGLWSNKKDIVNVDIYLDDFRLMANEEMEEPAPPTIDPDLPINPGNDVNSIDPIVVIIIVACVIIVASAIIIPVLIIRKKKKN